MDSNQLQQFRAIAECGSITKAAQKLYVTQPALSIAISKLENELGCRLFTRDGKQVTLTVEGQKLLGYAAIVTDTIRQAEEYFAQRSQENAVRCFRIGGINYPLLTRGCTSVEGRFFSGILVNESELRRATESGEADIILADERHMPAVPEFYTQELLYQQSLLLLCPSSHPLAERAEISIVELQEFPVVGHANPHGFTAWIREIKRINRCNIREDANLDSASWRTEGHTLPLPYLMNNFGISTVWDVVRGWKALPVTGKYTQRDIYMWYRAGEDERLTPIVQKIRDNTQAILLADQGYLNFIFHS